MKYKNNIIFTHGLTATMKSEIAKYLGEIFHCEIIRTDDFRLEMAKDKGVDFSSVDAMKVTNDIIYNRAFSELQKLVDDNYLCILDSTSRAYDYRHRLYEFCETNQLSPIMIRCYCSYGLSKFRIENFRQNNFDFIGSNTEEHLLFGMADYEFPSMTEPCSMIEFHSGTLTVRAAKIRTTDKLVVNRILDQNYSSLHHYDWIYDEEYRENVVDGEDGLKNQLESISVITEKLDEIILTVQDSTMQLQILKTLERTHSHMIRESIQLLEVHIEQFLKDPKNRSKGKIFVKEVLTGASGSLLATLIQNVCLSIPEYYQVYAAFKE